MRILNTILLAAVAALIAFGLGRWTQSASLVRADSGGTPAIDLHAVTGSTSLTVFYPNLNKLFVYQNPFVGLPTWSCSYSVQLSTPGGKVEREPCPNR
jgi:hypothetical protein